MLTSTLPKTPGEKAAIARARQLSDVAWTPILDLPAYIHKENRHIVLPAGKEILGLPYSSTEKTDQFIPENVSFKSFLSAVANPHSALYRAGHGKGNRPNFGIVCNSFVRYAFGIPYRVPTELWFTLPGMRLVSKAGEYSAEEIRLCDVLHVFGAGRNHVAMITDVLRNDLGEIEEIEVSEATPPCCKRERYPLEKYFEVFKLFSLCRYDRLEEVPPFNSEENRVFESGISAVLPKIAVDHGEDSNYLLGEEVVLSVFADEADEVELYGNGALLQSFGVGERAFLPLSLERGYYQARLKKDGSQVEFAVVGAEISHKAENGALTVYANPCDGESRILYMDFRRAGEKSASMSKYEPLTEEEAKTGIFSRPIPADAINFKVYFQNRNGVWTHPMTKIETK